MKVRLADIAARAGVSEATVSRVLNDKPGVAESTRQAVLTSLDVLGYDRPSRLVARSAGLVGLVVPELDNPVFPLFAQVVESGLARNGYTSVLCTLTPGGVHEDVYVQMLLDRGVSGIIFVSGIHAIADTDPVRYRALIERGVPIVLVNGYLPGVEAPFVSNDDFAAADLAVGHLVQLGHRRIGMACGPRRYTTVQRRVAGFVDAVRRHLGPQAHDEPEALVEPTFFRVEGGAAAAGALLDRGATAIVCGSDLMALGAVRAAHGRGLRVPQDVSIIGSDDNPLLEFTDPPLTTVRQPVGAMGEAAVRALLDGIGGLAATHAEYVFRPELVVRGSTAAAPGLLGPRRDGARAAATEVSPVAPASPAASGRRRPPAAAPS